MNPEKLAWQAITIAASAAEPNPRRDEFTQGYGALDHLCSLISHEFSRGEDDRQVWYALSVQPRNLSTQTFAARALQSHLSDNPPFRRALIHAVRLAIAGAGRQAQRRRTPRCRVSVRR